MLMRELEAARHKNGRLITVEDRPVADGDNTVIDFKWASSTERHLTEAKALIIL